MGKNLTQTVNEIIYAFPLLVAAATAVTMFGGICYQDLKCREENKLLQERLKKYEMQIEEFEAEKRSAYEKFMDKYEKERHVCRNAEINYGGNKKWKILLNK